MSYAGPGSYRHYKGGIYQVFGLGQPEALGLPAGNGETFEGADMMVVYAPYMPDRDVLESPMDFWLRPLPDFNEKVPVKKDEKNLYSKHVPRFEMIESFRQRPIEVRTIALYLAKNMTPPDRPLPNERVFYADAENILSIIGDLRAGKKVHL